MDVEDVFSSRVRMKILKVLMQVGELNVSQITRRLGVNYKTTDKHLKVLEEEDMVKQKVFGRIRLYQLNHHSPKTKAVKDLMQVWEETDKQ